MMKKIILIGLVICFCLALAGAEQKFEVEKQYSIVIHSPEGEGAFPCVILCPGRGYHKDLPLMKSTAEELVKSGFIAVRFDWSFYLQGSSPSLDLSTERQDILRALDLAKQNAKLDLKRVYLVGKSLGSVVAYWEFAQNPAFAGILLQTPIIPQEDDAEIYYPGLLSEKRPVAFVIGDQDTENCPLKELYKYAAKAETAIPIISLSGGHGFQTNTESKNKEQSELDQQSLDLAIKSTIFWLKAFDQRIK